ncbi:high affinity immunoglobulin gamma Fc receptor I-like isoform X4 [Catharus ustulatus]|uniref:high affinity immunoglobulin gamma Fc receptor I-like isoform X4 n=1 Tax=Catharus ustulatus TaxID=91951 RepID=UPI00140CFD75|nr:high affinity immunoglobulin gamma Fc receptor I-like isoform X4 [Catharus ustulatus]
MAGDSGMAGKVALLLWGAQTPQLLVEPPWTPAVLWDRVTLTCQGSGTAGATTWYKDGRAWGQEGPDIFTVTRSGTYQCQRPGTGLSPPVTVSDDWLVLQVPARALLEGDTVTLRCRVWQNNPVTSVSFYRDGKELGTLQNGTELSLSPLQRNHSGHYHCRGWLGFLGRWEQSEPVAVTVQELFPVPVLEGPPELPEGSPLNLSCLSTPSPTGPPWGHPCPPEIFLVSALCPLTPPWGDPIPDISPSNPSLPCPPPPTAGASPSPRPQPCLCPRSARGQCHHHPRSPGTPGDTTAGGDTTGNHWTPLEHSACRRLWVPAVPGPSHCGRLLWSPHVCQEAPGKGPPAGGSSGHLHGAAGATGATLGTQ